MALQLGAWRPLDGVGQGGRLALPSHHLVTHGVIVGMTGSGKTGLVTVLVEVFGFLPPHPANPPTKRPLVALMKQARAFGVGVVVATQNPMDLDYRALSNAGLWCVGRLQTDADRARVLEGLAQSNGASGSLRELSGIVKKLNQRWFLLRDVHDARGTRLLQPRWAMSFMRGPMTRREIQRARKGVEPKSPAPPSAIDRGTSCASSGE